jgi:hypothetical protein
MSQCWCGSGLSWLGVANPVGTLLGNGMRRDLTGLGRDRQLHRIGVRLRLRTANYFIAETQRCRDAENGTPRPVGPPRARNFLGDGRSGRAVWPPERRSQQKRSGRVARRNLVVSSPLRSSASSASKAVQRCSTCSPDTRQTQSPCRSVPSVKSVSRIVDPHSSDDGPFRRRMTT